MLSVQSSASRLRGEPSATSLAPDHPRSGQHHPARVNTAMVQRIIPSHGLYSEDNMPEYLRVTRGMMQSRKPHPPRPLNVDENLNKLAAPVRGKGVERVVVLGGDKYDTTDRSGGSGGGGSGGRAGRGNSGRDVKMSTKLAAINDANGGSAKSMVKHIMKMVDGNGFGGAGLGLGAGYGRW